MRERYRTVLVSTGIFVVLLIFVDLALHLAIEPSPDSSGRLLGRELPPFRIVPKHESTGSNRSEPYDQLIVDGKRITFGDLYGTAQSDPVVGYAPAENWVSANGWWQTNDIGARGRRPAQKSRPSGQRRLLVFGDSFALASRVKQEDMWTVSLAENLPRTDVVNFGADGYGMAQAYLRYGEVKDRLDHDMVLVLFPPTADMWRDINTYRPLLGWHGPYSVLPRFVIEDGELRLVRGPEDTIFLATDPGVISPRLRDHLVRYDRFYLPLAFEQQPILGNSVLFRLAVSVGHLLWRHHLYEDILYDDEATRVTARILCTMAAEVGRDGRTFVLVFLPYITDLDRLEHSGKFQRRWREVYKTICHDGPVCIDLAPDLMKMDRGQMDTGFDGTHYGPRMNHRIGELVSRHLLEQHVAWLAR